MGDDLFDEDGLLRPERVRDVAVGDPLLVFLQRVDARIEIAPLAQQAARFFRTKIGLMAPKRYGERSPSHDAASVVVAGEEGRGEPRTIFLRPAQDADWLEAERFEIERSATGLGGLARRCRFVAEIERTEAGDRVALLLAAIIASTWLGPIMDRTNRDLFGVKTARLRLTPAPPSA